MFVLLVDGTKLPEIRKKKEKPQNKMEKPIKKPFSWFFLFYISYLLYFLINFSFTVQSCFNTIFINTKEINAPISTHFFQSKHIKNATIFYRFIYYGRSTCFWDILLHTTHLYKKKVFFHQYMVVESVSFRIDKTII